MKVKLLSYIYHFKISGISINVLYVFLQISGKVTSISFLRTNKTFQALFEEIASRNRFSQLLVT